MMFTCQVCGSSEASLETVAEVFEVDGRRVLVENIPILVCGQCGEMSFSVDTAEKVRRIVRGETPPAEVTELELYDFA